MMHFVVLLGLLSLSASRPTELLIFSSCRAGWATYGPQAILVQPARPAEEKNNIDKYYVYLFSSGGLQPAKKITTLFRPAAEKRLPTTDVKICPDVKVAMVTLSSI